MEVAQEHKIATGRKMRVDTTVVETDIHYPTDSTLLGDGVRVLTRIMKKVTAVAGKAGSALKILGVGQSRTTGLRRGVVSDIEETTRSIRKALQDAERYAVEGNVLLVYVKGMDKPLRFTRQP